MWGVEARKMIDRPGWVPSNWTPRPSGFAASVTAWAVVDARREVLIGKLRTLAGDDRAKISFHFHSAVWKSRLTTLWNGSESFLQDRGTETHTPRTPGERIRHPVAWSSCRTKEWDTNIVPNMETGDGEISKNSHFAFTMKHTEQAAEDAVLCRLTHQLGCSRKLPPLLHFFDFFPIFNAFNNKWTYATFLSTTHGH